jgi:carotenoid cleavage dioxygenase-like enzyme
MTTTVNPYLDGNFAPVRTEITGEDLPVKGEIPPDLCGIFVRNGPNPQFAPIGQYHWFDGDGMLHGVEISNGKAHYRNRYVQTKGWHTEHEAGRAIWTGLLEPPKMDNPHGAYKNVANTALVWHDGRLLTLWEGGEPYQIKVPELETLGSYTYGNQLKTPFTAHPKVDAVTGEMMFFGYSPFQPPYLYYSLVSAEGKLVKTVPIDLPVGVMMHDFAITEHYTLFMDLPLTFRPERARQGQPVMGFEPESPSRFGIVPRHGDNSSIRWFESPACYVFHTLNAYEEGDEVVLLACRMNSTNVLGDSVDEATLDAPGVEVEERSRDSSPRLYEWRFNLKTGAVIEKPLDDIASDFPRVNEQHLGRPTRYGYTARISPQPTPLFDGLIKYDLLSDRSQVHEFGKGRYGGEAVFVPRPDGTAEDDGWLLTFVHDQAENTSELVIVNAQDITAQPVAQIKIPQRVPYGFHGVWIAQS